MAAPATAAPKSIWTLATDEPLPMPRFFLILCLLFAGCSGKEPLASLLQSPAGEAVVRRVFADCPHKDEAKISVLLLGDHLGPASREFETRLADLPAKPRPHRLMNYGSATGLMRIYDTETGQHPLQLQIQTLEPVAGKTDEFTSVAGWAWKESAGKARYVVKKGADGKFSAEKLEDIPLPKPETPATPAPVPAAPAPSVPAETK